MNLDIFRENVKFGDIVTVNVGLVNENSGAFVRARWSVLTNKTNKTNKNDTHRQRN